MRKSSSLSLICGTTISILLFMPLLFSRVGLGKDAKILHLNETGTATVVVSGRGTVLSFPTKPTKVILGKANSFGVEYVDSDLAISPLSPTARSHLFVYMYGRRFSFDLVTSMSDGSAVILVRDAKEIPIEVKP